MDRLERLETPVYTALRVIAGLLFLMHGADKLFDLFKPGPEVLTQKWIGGVIELAGGALIAAGLFTRAAAFLACGTMAVAYFQFHFKFNFADNQWLPMINKGEPAVLFCFLFLYMTVRGAGPISLDRKLRKV